MFLLQWFNSIASDTGMLKNKFKKNEKNLNITRKTYSTFFSYNVPSSFAY